MTMKYVLAVDTATEACSAALWSTGEIAERFAEAGRGHTKLLLPMVQELLAHASLRPAQLDGVICGVGPGSFSGLRIGVGFVQGFAVALELPVVGASSLAMLAQQSRRVHHAERALAAIDARMDEVYFGAFVCDPHGRMSSVGSEHVCAPDRVPRAAAGEWFGIGTGWRVHETALRTACGATLVGVDGAALPHAQDALTLGLPELQAGRGRPADDLAPRYLRDRVALTLAEQAQSRRKRE